MNISLNIAMLCLLFCQPYETFPPLQGSIYVRYIEPGQLQHQYIHTTHTHILLITGYRLRQQKETPTGHYQYNWLISHTGNSWQVLARTCDPYLQVSTPLEAGWRLHAQIWYIDEANGWGATSDGEASIIIPAVKAAPVGKRGAIYNN